MWDNTWETHSGWMLGAHDNIWCSTVSGTCDHSSATLETAFLEKSVQNTVQLQWNQTTHETTINYHSHQWHSSAIY